MTQDCVIPKIPVLNYHHVHDRRESFFRVTPDDFRAQLELLLHERFQPIDAGTLVGLKGAAAASQKFVLVTFDDAYDDFAEFAWPILRELNVPATLFIIACYVGLWNDWDPLRPSRQRHLSLEALKALCEEGLDPGSHTCTHRPLVALDAASLRAEIDGSRRELEAMLGRKVPCLAYPGGHVDPQVCEQARCVYDLGFATGAEHGGRFGDPYRIVRFDPSFCTDAEEFRRQLKLHSDPAGG